MKHICHISVLNPLRHSRIYYRWGLATKEMGHDVSIIAQGSVHDACEHGIKLMGTGSFHRLSSQRLFFAQSIRQMALETQADIYVLHSPELLGLGKWLKKKTGAKLIYDVHEDYQANILHAKHYPQPIRRPLAHWVRKRETKALSFLDAVVYAEECYKGMLPVEEGKLFVLRNKFTPQATRNKAAIQPPSEPYMLYTGTLAWPWGLKESYDCWRAMTMHSPVKLIVAGFDARGEVVDELQKWIKRDGNEDRVQIMGGKEYVSYGDIVALIKGCLCGMAFYHLQPNIIGKIPTKFYEFMAMGKPLLFTRESNWQRLNQQLPFGIDVSMGEWEEVDFAEKLYEKIENWQSRKLPKESYDFCGEHLALKSLLEGLNH